MTLKLSYTQRLNIHALMGQQRCSVDEVRIYWRLQDEIKLSKEEERAINYKLVAVNGGPPQQATWDITEDAPSAYDFSADDYARIRKVIKEWQPGFLTTADRLWLEPLLAQFDASDKPELVAGKKKASAAN